MGKGLEGIKVIEVGGAVAMPLVGMLMGSWGAEVIHVEPPNVGDNWRKVLGQGMGGWAKPHSTNYYWEHVDRNKKSIAINLGSKEGQSVLHKLISSADVFLNNLRPYEMKKFNLSYPVLSKMNSKLIFANVTGYGQKGPEKDVGGYDSVAFWARSGVMELMHDIDNAPNISRPGYGDSITSLSLLAGIMTALFVRERTGIGQEVEVSLYHTATWVLGCDISGCLITGEDAIRPQRKSMGNPIRNVYETKDKRWIMLGMTNAQHYWPNFCKAIDRPELENDPKYATIEVREKNASHLVKMIGEIFAGKTASEWAEILSATNLIWSVAATPLEVTKDRQAIENEFFVDWNHPVYGRIKVLNNPIKLSLTQAQIQSKAPDLGEHTDEIMKDLRFSATEIENLKNLGAIK
jgi:formyl-CoA transferase